jgi:hypothetical protein
MSVREIHEPERLTPVIDSMDVAVCGAGPAGVSAAIQAARAGARTRLLEVHGCLGGIWTAGLLSYVIDADKPHGLLPEITDRLRKRGAYRHHFNANFLYDPEQMKIVLEEMCLEAGVEIQLHTRVSAAHVDSSRRLDAVMTESKSGRQAWMAKVFIDCTGDGDLGALAGCDFSIGRETDGMTQPMSLMALISGLDPEVTRPFHDNARRDRKLAFLAELARGGFQPSYSAPTIFHIQDDLFALMIDHQYSVSPLDAQAVTDATLRARGEIDHAVRSLRALGGIWKSLRLISTAAQIGVREGRRLKGRQTVVSGDLASGKEWRDSVCRATSSMDVHSPDPQVSKDFDFRTRSPVLPYDIPYGAMVAADVDGLMMAGRCISGDFLAHSSYRVTGNAVAMGESAGTAAAYCAQNKIAPHELTWPINAI